MDTLRGQIGFTIFIIIFTAFVGWVTHWSWIANIIIWGLIMVGVVKCSWDDYLFKRKIVLFNKSKKCEGNLIQLCRDRRYDHGFSFMHLNKMLRFIVQQMPLVPFGRYPPAYCPFYKYVEVYSSKHVKSLQ